MWYKVLSSLIISAGILWGAQRVAGFMMKRNPELKACHVTQTPVNAEILVHGSCEPEYMIDPDVIDSVTSLKTYNLASDHSDFADNFLDFYLYLKKQKDPRYLFLYVSPPAFDKNVSNIFQTFKYVSFMDDPVVYYTVKENDPYFTTVSNIPFVRFSYYSHFTMSKIAWGAGSFMLNSHSEPKHPNGFRPPIPRANNPLNEFWSLMPEGGKYTWFDIREKYLRKIIELAQKHHIIVTLYESPAYFGNQPVPTNRGEFEEKIRRIANEYHVQYLKYDDLEMAKDPSNFFTTVNMTYKGAMEFSRIFATSINEKVIQKTNQQFLKHTHTSNAVVKQDKL